MGDSESIAKAQKKTDYSCNVIYRSRLISIFISLIMKNLMESFLQHPNLQQPRFLQLTRLYQRLLDPPVLKERSLLDLLQRHNKASQSWPPREVWIKLPWTLQAWPAQHLRMLSKILLLVSNFCRSNIDKVYIAMFFLKFQKLLRQLFSWKNPHPKLRQNWMWNQYLLHQ